MPPGGGQQTTSGIQFFLFTVGSRDGTQVTRLMRQVLLPTQSSHWPAASITASSTVDLWWDH